MNSANAINDGTECAVSEAERIDNLLEMARQVQTDVRPSQYTPLKRACVEIDRLRDVTKGQAHVVKVYATEISGWRFLVEGMQMEIDDLRRPWWVKLLTWATA